MNYRFKNKVNDFARNQALEDLLEEINSLLTYPERLLLRKQNLNDWPMIFILGAHRSGSTLMMQWLANLGLAYPTNLLSRFYRAPIMGAKLQLLLADEHYNYRDELKNFSSNVDFSSDNGKTKGALAPNEFWYFWRRFLPFEDLDYLPTNKLFEQVNTELLKNELSGVVDILQKPMALKAMILNYNVDFLDYIFPNAIFVHIKRNPLTNIESALEARQRQLGSVDYWYSFKIPEYYNLVERDPYEQVAGQIYYINQAVEAGLCNVAEHKKMTVHYEDFCQAPQQIFRQLKSKLAENGYQWEKEYNLQDQFDLTRQNVKNEAIWRAYEVFYR